MHPRLPILFPLAIVCALPAQWLQIPTLGAPSARANVAMTDGGGRVVLFGGDNASPLLPGSDQTFTYDGATWTLLMPPARPSARTGARLAFDRVRGVFVLFGGLVLDSSGVGGPVADTWEFDGTDWTQRLPVTSPDARSGYGLCYDAARQRTVLYGGATAGGPVGDTWEWDGTDWIAVPTLIAPGPLSRPGMIYHAGLARTVLFGGSGGGTGTWLFDGSTWTLAATGPTGPIARDAPGFAYDDVRGVGVLTGGFLLGLPFGAIDDTWEFDGLAWRQIPSTVTPARGAGGLAFDAARRRMVLFGGLATSPFGHRNDTWEYGARTRPFGTGCAGVVGEPTLRALDAPRLGLTYTMRLQHLNPTAVIAGLALGLATIVPTPLDPLGMPGCTAYVRIDALVTFPASNGAGDYTMTIPAELSLLGAELFAQGLSFDPGVNAAGLTTSAALAGTVGN